MCHLRLPASLSFCLFPGSIPPVLGSLTKLKRLDLSHNRLTGVLPLRFGSLGEMQLQELLLHDNMLSGEIPSWPQLSQLVHLDLHNNQLCGNVPLSHP